MPAEQRKSDQSPKLRPLALFIACATGLVLSVYPVILARTADEINHTMLTLFGFAVVAGLVSGVGFIPKYKIWRVLFSANACYACFGLGVLLKIYQ